MATRSGRKAKKAKTDEPTGTARDEQSSAVEQATEGSLADDAPDAVTTATESVSNAKEQDSAGEQEIDSRFDGQDIAVEDQLADMIGQTAGDEDPLAAQFGDITAGHGAAGRERLADIAADLLPDDADQEAGPKYGKGMISADGGGGSDKTVTSGHPGAYGIVTDKDGEVTGHYAAAPEDGNILPDTLFGIEVGNIRYDQEMTKKANEAQQNSGSGGGGSGGSGTGGSGTGGSGGSGSGTPAGGGGSGSGSGTGSSTQPTTVDNGDGSITTTYSDGTSVTTNPDGSQAVIHPDGSMDLYDKDGNLVEHQDPPPKEDPPPEDKKDDGDTKVESQPDEDYVDPETERLLREELAKDPQFAYYQKQRGADGAIDPAEDEIGFQVTPGAEVPDARARYGLDGDPVGPDEIETGGGPSDAGYYDDPNHGAIDPGEDEVVSGGPTRNDDPFDGVGQTPKPAASSDDAEAESTDDGGGSFLPPSDIAGPVDTGPELPDAVIEEPVE